MRVDVNAFWGRWPFRHLPQAGSVGALVEDRKTHRIAETWVSPLDGFFHADPAAANRELHAQFARVPGIRSVSLVNPLLPDAGRDLSRRKGQPLILRLAPTYHSYDLADERVATFLREIESTGKTVVLMTVRLLDRRSQPPAFLVDDLPVEKALDVAQHYPALQFILTGACLREAMMVAEMGEAAKNVGVDLSLVDGLDGVAVASRALQGRMFFGSSWPLHYTLAARMKLENTALTPAEIAGVLAAGGTVLKSAAAHA